MGTGSGNFFSSHFASVPRCGGDKEIEKRSFKLGQKAAKTIRDTVFGDGWTPLQAVSMCFAVTGVQYHDKTASLDSPADSSIDESAWIEHYTRKACKALSKEDDGYETESFAQRCKVERENHRDSDGDGFGFSDDEGFGCRDRFW